MRRRVNILAVAVVLAIASFVYARYAYATRSTAQLGNDVTVENPFMDRDLAGD